MKVRIKFIKQKHLKYIGHLDMLRLFQRCIRRAELPVEYSKGFNPHQLLYIALPLPLGATSEGEYLDIELSNECDLSILQIKEKLNEVLPQGLQIKNIIVLDKTMKAGMAAVNAAEYNLLIHKEKVPLNFYQNAQDFLNQEEIWIEKEGKKEIKRINIKNKIYRYHIVEDKEKWIINLLLATGSQDNLKPETVIKELYNYNHTEYKEYEIQLHRIDIFTKFESELIPLSSISKGSE